MLRHQDENENGGGMFMKKFCNRSFRSLCLVFLSAVMFLSSFLSLPVYADEASVTITKQPEDAEVPYPSGASFLVQVDHPENVASYKWYLSDGWTVFELDGESAASDMLIIPSTEYRPNPHYLVCEITDKNGNKIYSEEAVMTDPDFELDKKVLYVGEYALQPGDLLDLGETGAGSGIVTFGANGVDITFENVSLSNEKAIFDRRLAPSLGVFFFGRHMSEPEINFHFEGDNVIENTFYDADYNSAGIDFNIYFGIEENAPTAVFDGDGTLTLKGGSNSIYADGNLDLGVNIIDEGLAGVYSDSITANTILVEGGTTLDLHPNGTGIRARGDLRTYEGSVIKVSSIAPHVSVGPTFKNLIQVAGGMYIQGTQMDLHGTAKAETFVPYSNYLVNYTGIALDNLGDLNLDHSSVDISFECEKSEEPFALNFCGILAGENSSSVVLDNASSISINMDIPSVMGSTGILAPGDVRVSKDSSIDINIASLGEVSAIEAERAFIVEDGTVSSSVKSYDESKTYGIVSGDVSVTLNDKKYSVSSIAENGLALAADTGERGAETIEPIENYEARKIRLGGKAVFTAPGNAAVNVYPVPGYGDTITAETIFTKGDYAFPAKEVKIEVKQDNAIWYGLGALAVLGLVGFLFLKKKKTKR